VFDRLGILETEMRNIAFDWKPRRLQREPI